MDRRRTALPAGALLLVVVAVLVVVLETGGGEDGPAPTPATTAVRIAPATSAPPVTPPPPNAATRKPLGLTEFDASLLLPDPAPASSEAMRDALAALRPQYLRVVVDWSKLQPSPEAPAQLDGLQDGCVRGVPPCAASAGVAAQLRAARARGWQVVVVVTGVPTWAARPPSGCEREGTQPRARPITPEGLQAYERLLQQVDDLGRSMGLTMGLVSPFNEPNHPAFLSPQRAACDTASPTLSPGVYAELVRAAQRALGARGVGFVLGELAGFRRASPRTTGVAEFVRALPDDVACAGAAWSQHEYASTRDEPAAPFARDAVAELEGALDARACTRGKPVWVTETGVGGAKSGEDRATAGAALAAQCTALAARLARWRDDPRVAAVFQYTFREDPVYPVGLADPALAELYPTYALWRTGSCPAPPAA